MAILIDTVYQRVLAIANKEQRGYVTPQEFNLMANQAQLSIFESYFYDKNMRERLEPVTDPETDETNISDLIGLKLKTFQESLPVTSGHTFLTTTTVSSVAYEIFQYGRIFYNDQVCAKVTVNEAERLKRSVRHIIDSDPIYADNRVTGRDIVVYAGSSTEKTSGVTVETFRVPKTAAWGYVVVNEQALYNSNTGATVDFELHKSEEDSLVFKILELGGITINKPGLVQIAAQKEQVESQTQKQ